jgi:hypothetical protein
MRDKRDNCIHKAEDRETSMMTQVTILTAIHFNALTAEIKMKCFELQAAK